MVRVIAGVWGRGGGVVASFHSRSGEVSGLVINGGSRPIIDTLSLTSAGIGGLSIIGGGANGGLWEGWPIVQGNGIKPRWSHLASDHSGCTYIRSATRLALSFCRGFGSRCFARPDGGTGIAQCTGCEFQSRRRRRRR